MFHVLLTTLPSWWLVQLFRLWLGVTEYLFRNPTLLDEIINTAIEDNTFRSDDLEFTFAARVGLLSWPRSDILCCYSSNPIYMYIAPSHIFPLFSSYTSASTPSPPPNRAPWPVAFHSPPSMRLLSSNETDIWRGNRAGPTASPSATSTLTVPASSRSNPTSPLGFRRRRGWGTRWFEPF